jgi:predicted TIM-barrel fold metal-dependent hydrolase
MGLTTVSLSLIPLSLTTPGCAAQSGGAILGDLAPDIIDVHGHLGRFEGYDLSLPTLLANIKEHKVKYVFVSNIDGAALPGVTADADEVSINQDCAKICAEHPELKPLAWVKPGATAANAANIEPFLRDQKFYGLKFHPDFNKFAADSEITAPYLRLCDKYHVPALFHCGQSARSSAEVIYRAARKFSQVPFVLYHMNFGGDHQAVIDIGRQARDRKDALIYLETAQTEAEWIVKAIKAVGSERVIFGTDATYYGRGHYRQYLPILSSVKRQVTASEFQQYINGNAREIFRLRS